MRYEGEDTGWKADSKSDDRGNMSGIIWKDVMRMCFTCMNQADYERWKKENPYVRERDTKLLITNLNDAARLGTEDGYLRKFLMDESLALTGAEHLWGEEGSQHFFNQMHDARKKQGLQTVLVTGLNEVQTAIFRYHMNISWALYKLSEYHSQMPECPVVFQGDGYAFIRNLYEWKSNVGVDMNIEAGRLLSEINPGDLPDRNIYPYQRDLGDYYLSIGRRSMALSAYLHGYYGVPPSNYAYLKRWDYLMAMAEAYTVELKNPYTSEIREGVPTALSILDKLIADTEQWKELEGADDFQKQAWLKKIMILGRTNSKEEGERLLYENLSWIKEAKGNLAFFVELMDTVDIYQGTDVSADLLLHIAGQSDELQTLQLFDKNRGFWVLGQSVRDGTYSADALREKLSHVDRMLNRFFYDYRED